MMRIKNILIVMVAAVFLLTGCNWGNNDMNEGRGSFDQTRTTRDGKVNNTNNGITNNVNNRDGFANDRRTNNRQDRFDVSDESAERIVNEIPEIDQAYVVTTKNNAYVAAMLNKEKTTPNDNLAKNDRRNNSTGMNIRNVNDRNVKNRTVNEGNANNRRSDNHMANRRDVESDEVTDAVKNKIADIVQDVDKDIDNVYVTTSPDFFDLTNNYVDDFRNGRPVQGFFDQMGNMIERIFPQNKR